MNGRFSAEDIHQDQDYFCMSAVKNSISQYKGIKSSTPAEVWHMQPTNNAFLQSVLHLIRSMQDLQRIIFILYFVASEAPEGADQVEAAYECYKFALEHEDILKDMPRAYEMVQKIKRKYPIFKVHHFLHLYGLDDDKLYQLLEHPKNLIVALYHHESIVEGNNKIKINLVSFF